ncbi:hypothetical protein [Dictyobacter formicarum]|uniref:Uncharacterized protein n=1 Tax=Dictyobacter formicarum TaxID=2778368 RepID=A0ABQ3V8S7_9CHLR|nr:hypothetical protein [Dictyobacter formicarum]GHO82300.1 hypothetical protein KSZ_03060 [Dictyobacter formicarum]
MKWYGTTYRFFNKKAAYTTAPGTEDASSLKNETAAYEKQNNEARIKEDAGKVGTIAVLEEENHAAEGKRRRGRENTLIDVHLVNRKRMLMLSFLISD